LNFEKNPHGTAHSLTPRPSVTSPPPVWSNVVSLEIPLFLCQSQTYVVKRIDLSGQSLFYRFSRFRAHLSGSLQILIFDLLFSNCPGRTVLLVPRLEKSDSGSRRSAGISDINLTEFFRKANLHPVPSAIPSPLPSSLWVFWTFIPLRHRSNRSLSVDSSSSRGFPYTTCNR